MTRAGTGPVLPPEVVRGLLDGTTPGRWEYFYKSKYNEWHVSVPFENTTMRLGLFPDGVPTATPEADARLIAAAPDLAQELQQVDAALARHKELPRHLDRAVQVAYLVSALHAALDENQKMRLYDRIQEGKLGRLRNVCGLLMESLTLLKADLEAHVIIDDLAALEHINPNLEAARAVLGQGQKGRKTMTETTKYYATFYIPGSFMPEEYTREITAPTPEAALSFLTADPDSNVFAFTLTERTAATTASGEELLGKSRAVGASRYYMPGGRIYTPDEVREEVGEDSILYRNVRSNHWSQILRTHLGNWQPLKDTDVVLSAR